MDDLNCAVASAHSYFLKAEGGFCLHNGLPPIVHSLLITNRDNVKLRLLCLRPDHGFILIYQTKDEDKVKCEQQGIPLALQQWLLPRLQAPNLDIDSVYVVLGSNDSYYAACGTEFDWRDLDIALDRILQRLQAHRQKPNFVSLGVGGAFFILYDGKVHFDLKGRVVHLQKKFEDAQRRELTWPRSAVLILFPGNGEQYILLSLLGCEGEVGAGPISSCFENWKKHASDACWTWLAGIAHAEGLDPLEAREFAAEGKPLTKKSRVDNHRPTLPPRTPASSNTIARKPLPSTAQPRRPSAPAQASSNTRTSSSSPQQPAGTGEPLSKAKSSPAAVSRPAPPAHRSSSEVARKYGKIIGKAAAKALVRFTLGAIVGADVGDIFGGNNEGGGDNGGGSGDAGMAMPATQAPVFETDDTFWDPLEESAEDGIQVDVDDDG